MIRVNVQLTREEVEILLDALGVEEKGDSADRKHLRRKLEETVQFIREQSPHSDVA